MADTKWVRFGYFPIFSLIVIMSITIMLWGDVNINRNAIVVAVVSFGIINILAIYFIGNLLEKEAEMQKMRLSQERNLSQMNLYRSMQTSFDQQRKYLHDYKNQLLCIQGLLEEGQTEETLCYVKKTDRRVTAAYEHDQHESQCGQCGIESEISVCAEKRNRFGYENRRLILAEPGGRGYCHPSSQPA